MKRVLFVDDEQEILDGLSNSLRKFRNNWESVFANGGEAALKEMKKASFDLIISDMRMPGIDGVQLLQLVKEEFPSTIRVILSGYAEKISMLKSVSVAHLFISKPCPTDDLVKTILRLLNIQSLLPDEILRAEIGRLSCLPSTSEAYWELASIIVNPNFTLENFIAIATRDPSLSAKLIQIANSSFFFENENIDCVDKAAQLLGRDTLKELVLCSDIFTYTEHTKDPKSKFLQSIQFHSKLVSEVAIRISQDFAPHSNALIAALVHDIGTLVLLSCKQGPFRNVSALAQESLNQSSASELSINSCPQESIGAYLLALWNFPDEIVKAIANQRTPSRLPEGQQKLAGIIHVANWLVDSNCRAFHQVNLPAVTLDSVFLAQNNLDEKLESWSRIAKNEIFKMEKSIEI